MRRALVLILLPFVQCVAVSPAGDRLAAGDATGRILIWHQLAAAVDSAAAAAAGGGGGPQSQQQQQPVAATVHWHAHAVRALAFSRDSLRLLSGGDEAVLVRSHRPESSQPSFEHGELDSLVRLKTPLSPCLLQGKHGAQGTAERGARRGLPAPHSFCRIVLPMPLSPRRRCCAAKLWGRLRSG